MIISPSILSMNYDNFNYELNELNQYADWIHFDVMDGHLVPNLSFGPYIFSFFRKNSTKFLDVHLMVEDPKYYSDVFIKAGADSIIFHYEAFNDIEKCIELLKEIKSQYIKCGISIKPKTSVKEVEVLLPYIDIFLVMSVEPGFGGQKFMPEALDKIKQLKEYKEKNGFNYVIEVDGGISDLTARNVIDAGADALVAGSYIFKGDIKTNIEKLRKCA